MNSHTIFKNWIISLQKKEAAGSPVPPSLVAQLLPALPPAWRPLCPPHHHPTWKHLSVLLPFSWKGLISSLIFILAAPFFHASSHPPFCLLHHYCSYSCFYHPSLRAALFSPTPQFLLSPLHQGFPYTWISAPLSRTPSPLFLLVLYFPPRLSLPTSPSLEDHLFCCNPGHKPSSHSAS